MKTKNETSIEKSLGFHILYSMSKQCDFQFVIRSLFDSEVAVKNMLLNFSISLYLFPFELSKTLLVLPMSNIPYDSPAYNGLPGAPN